MWILSIKQVRFLPCRISLLASNGNHEQVTSPKKMIGGADRDRTGDPLLAKQVLSQLSYSPT